jgi:hypothetical protein
MYRNDILSDPDTTRLPTRSPWSGVALGATLQGAAHMMFAAGLLLLFLMVGVATAAPPSGPSRDSVAIGMTIFAMVAWLAILFNWVLSMVAAGVLACAEIGPRPRGLAIGLLACAAVALLSLPMAHLLSFAIWEPGFRGGMGPFGGPSGGMAALGLWSNPLIFLLCELARLSLVGFYVSESAHAAQKPNLAGSGQLLGVLTPVLLIVIFVFSVLVIAVSASGPGTFGPGRGGDWILPILSAVFGGALILLLLFAGALMFRLASAAGRTYQEREPE